ncbi:hypothetical protein F4778DRAFT_528919 [Xylariomycetidae sp. FL2044]|nr:hypothetical protein F4778DRAFT_528919 [Xylariomycetidae sp. FL2044]
MPALGQESSLWTSYRELSNYEIETHVIRGRHILELLHAELRSRTEDLNLVPEVDEVSQIQKKIEQSATRIQRDGLRFDDRRLISEPGNLGIAIIRENGMASAKEGLTKWNTIAYVELVWLVLVTTTPAHALLLVISVGKQRLQRLNLGQKSILVSFIKKNEQALACEDLGSAATSLSTTQAGTCDRRRLSIGY